jgi:hypothetical protein
MRYIIALLKDYTEHMLYSLQQSSGLVAGILLWAIGNALNAVGVL